MIDDLGRVVESIGQLSDRAEADRWEVCKAVSDAFQELPAYHHGLLSGLCIRLKKSSDTVYSYRNAEDLRARLKVPPSLSVSHFVTLHGLISRYSISDDEAREWLAHVTENDMSCRDMSQEIQNAYIEDAKSSFVRRSRRAGKLITALWTDSESCGLPEGLREQLKKIHALTVEFVADVDSWV